MKNIHLVPPIITDLCESALDARRNKNERDNYYLRINAVKEYCEAALKKIEKSENARKYEVRK